MGIGATKVIGNQESQASSEPFVKPDQFVNPEQRIFGSGEMAGRVRALDWTGTSVGPMSAWPDALLIFVNSLLANQQPQILFWGDDLTQFYNDAAIAVLGPDKHPDTLGRSGREAWAEVWPIVGRQIDAALGGEPCWVVDQLAPILRNGKLRDAWWTYCYSPVRDAQGVIRGVLITTQETTDHVLMERGRSSERDHLVAVFHHAPAFFALLRGPDHIFELTNPAYQRLIGGRSVIGRTIREALPEVIDQGYVAILDRVYRTGEAYVGHGERVLLDPGDGRPPEERRLDFLYQPLREQAGEVSGILVFGVDISERLRSEQQLRDERERFDFAAEAAGIGYWFCDLPFDKLAWDARVKEHFWLPVEADVDIDLFYQLLHPDDRERTRRAIEESIANHTAYDIEYRTVSPEGEHKWIRAMGRTAYSSDGMPLRFDGVTLDITDLKAAQMARSRAEEALLRSEKLAVVGRLAATISHEINNPLEAVMNLLFLIETSATDEVSRAYTRSAQDELTRVAHIVTHTLRFNRQSQSRGHEPLSEILDSAVAIYEARLRHAAIQLVRDLGPGTPTIQVGSDLRQVFANLIGNAFDASSPGGRIVVRARIRRSYRTGAQGVRVTIADTGHGMDAATRRGLFEPFFTTKGEKGTGLGLWVSREILHKHGATIAVRSRKQPGGSGTAFSVWIPLPVSIPARASH